MKIKKKFSYNKFIWWFEPEECYVNEKPNNGWTEKINNVFKPYVKYWENWKEEIGWNDKEKYKEINNQLKGEQNIEKGKSKETSRQTNLQTHCKQN